MVPRMQKANERAGELGWNAGESVVLVDGTDRETGRAEKLWAHRNGGVRHRAFSVLLWNGKGECLLQRRAAGKYHFPGLWTNACCSHPRAGEEVEAAAKRRLKEELGLEGVALRERFVFEYRAASAATGLWEWEVDHVLEGMWEGRADEVSFDPGEVWEVRWATPEEIAEGLRRGGEEYTPWFAEVWGRIQHCCMQNAE